MNYDGWANKETKQANYYLQNVYELYQKALDFKERSIDSDTLAYHLKDLLKNMIKEDKKSFDMIGEIDKVDFREIAKAFYDE